MYSQFDYDDDRCHYCGKYPEIGPPGCCDGAEREKHRLEEEAAERRNNPERAEDLPFKSYFYSPHSVWDSEDDWGLEPESDHHKIGHCEVIKETPRGILGKIYSSPNGSKFSLTWKRWFPRSHIANNKLGPYPDNDSLGPYCHVGDRGNLWVSGWLMRKLKMEKDFKDFKKLSDEELSKLSIQVRNESLRREQEARKREWEEDIHYAGVNTESFDSVTTGVFIFIPIESIDENDVFTPDIRPDLKELGLNYIPFNEDIAGYVGHESKRAGWIVPIKVLHNFLQRGDFYGGKVFEVSEKEIEKLTKDTKTKFNSLLKKYNGEIFFGGVSNVIGW